jgi:hypothetical protein
MITIIIEVIIGLILALIITRKCDIEEKKTASIYGLLIGGFFGFITAIAIIPSETETITDDILYLEALQDNNSIEGNFFLGCGRVNGEMKYIFYYKTDGGYKMGELNKNVLIKYTNERPRIEIYKKIKTDAYTWSIYLEGCDCENTVIYVPKGTIKQYYNLDAK